MTVAAQTQSTAAATASRRGRVSPERLRELSLFFAIVFALALFSTTVDNYLSGRFFNRVSVAVAITALLAAGEAVVIIARHVDLSVGSIVGVSAYSTGQLLTHSPGLSPILAILIAGLVGATLGAINGVLVAYARVPSIVVTLGTLAVFRAVLVQTGGGATIHTSDLPSWLVDLPRSTVLSLGDFDLRTMFIVAFIITLLLQFVLTLLRAGRRLYAIGSNPEAARQIGLPEARVTFVAFVVCGFLAGLAGFMYLGQFGNINVTAGEGLELAAIAAAVVGGVSIQGGSGTTLGALLGAVLISVLDLSLSRVPQVSEFWKDALLGALILGAVVLDVVVHRRFRARRRFAAAQADTSWEERSSGQEVDGE